MLAREAALVTYGEVTNSKDSNTVTKIQDERERRGRKIKSKFLSYPVEAK